MLWARAREVLGRDWDRQEALFVWAPVWLACGIGLYFALTAEPPVAAAWAALAGAGGLAAATFRWPPFRVPLIALALALFGLGWVQLSPLAPGTAMLAKPLGPVEVAGRVLTLEPLDEDGAARVLLAPTSIERHEGPLPRRLRLRVPDAADLAPGRDVTLLARLLPPGPPVAPGAFDFQRQAYFEGIGAVGFAYRVERLGPAPPWWRGLIPGLRAEVNARIMSALDGPPAGMAMALITGTRGALPEVDVQAMRDSGLMHVLSISGVHVGMVAGLVFFALRLAMAAWPALALTHPIKKYAAGAAFAVAVFYMFLAGAPTPTQRATIMTGVVLLALMADRWPFSLRTVAAAALIVLVVQPGALMTAGLQMSFAAAAALVYAFERAAPWIGPLHARSGLLPRAGIYVGGVVLTDLVASAATTPFSAFHFQQVAVYTLLGNGLTAPLFSFLIMPAAILAVLLMPLGLEWAPLQAMGWGIEGVLATARAVAALPGARLIPIAWPGLVLPCLAALTIGLVLLRGWARLAVLVPLALWALLVWGAAPPGILVSPSGKLVGVYDTDALYLSAARADRFARGVWERRYGLPAGAAAPFDAPGSPLRCDAQACRATLRGHRVSIVMDPYAAGEECAWADVLIAPRDPVRRRDCPGPRILVDRFDVYYDGAHAVFLGPLRVQSVAAQRGLRPWSARSGE